MGKLRLGHICEAVFWLALATFLYIESFDFDRGIEIYKFGATGWPRALLLLVAVAAIGQFLFQFVAGDKATSGTVGAASDDGAEEAARQSGHSHFRWYVSTFSLLILPFLYMRSHDHCHSL